MNCFAMLIVIFRSGSMIGMRIHTHVLVQRIGGQIIGTDGRIVGMAPGPSVVRIIDLFKERLDEDTLRLSCRDHVAAWRENVGSVL